MKRHFLLFAATWFGVAAAALGDEPTPTEILRQAADAMKQVRSVTYQAQTSANGVLKSHLPTMNGQVTMAGQPIRLRVTAEVNFVSRGEKKPIEAASDGRRVILVDHGDQQYQQIDLPTGEGLLSGVSPLLVRDLVSEEPLQRELTRGALTSEGTADVDGEPCDVVYATFVGEKDSVRWFLSQADHLPRQVERVIGSPVGDTRMMTTIVSLKTNVTVENEVFALKPPPGYGQPKPRTARPQRSENLLKSGSLAPDWTLKTPTGTDLSLKSLRGNVVLLDFWATWCGPCKRAMPNLQKLHEKYKDKPVKIIGVNCWERGRGADPVKMMKQAGYTYPIVLGGGSVARAYGVRGIPTFYLIDPDGKIMLATSGLNAEKERQIERLIEESVEALTKKKGG